MEEIKKGASASGVPNEVPRLAELCRNSSWITFLASGMSRKRSVVEVGRHIDSRILPRFGDYFIDRIEITDIDTWVRDLGRSLQPRTVRGCISILRRILSKARGQYKLVPLDWDLVTLPKVTDEHAKQNRLTVDEIVEALQVVRSEYPFYAPMIFALYSTGLRYCHVAAMRWAKLSASGVVVLEESYDYKTKVFEPINARKNAPPEVHLEPYTLELVRAHRRWLMADDHPGLTSGLLFPSIRGDLPVGNDQLNDVWREAQLKAGITKPVSVHGIRHTFHDVARRLGIDSATVKAMAGHATDARHHLYAQGVGLDEVSEASRKMGALVERATNVSPRPTHTQEAMTAFFERAKRPSPVKESRDAGRDAEQSGRSDREESGALVAG